jgi:hypothetical protein
VTRPYLPAAAGQHLVNHEPTNIAVTIERLPIFIAGHAAPQQHSIRVLDIRTQSSRQSTASGDEISAASNPASRVVCPQPPGAGRSDVGALAPKFQFEESRLFLAPRGPSAQDDWGQHPRSSYTFCHYEVRLLYCPRA